MSPVLLLFIFIDIMYFGPKVNRGLWSTVKGFVQKISKKMQIGQLAKQTGVSRDAIRLYEQMGLLVGVTRPNEYNNYKDYAVENVQRIEFIKNMKGFGLTLNECKEIFRAFAEGEMSDSYRQEFLAKKLQEIDSKIERLEGMRRMFLQFTDHDCDREELMETYLGGNEEKDQN